MWKTWFSTTIEKSTSHSDTSIKLGVCQTIGKEGYGFPHIQENHGFTRIFTLNSGYRLNTGL